MSPILLVVAVLGSAGVDMTLSGPASPVGACGVAEVKLVLSTDASASVAAVDAILSWDPAKLEFIQAIPSGAGWFVANFLNDPDGINDDLTDGDALFTALANPASPVALPPDALVATFQFRVLADAQVDLLPTLGAFGSTDVFGPIPGQVLTGTLSGPASITALSVPSTEVSRVGAPANPDVFKPGVTSGPVIGGVWDPVIDHSTFLPTGLLDLMLISGTATNIPVPPFGTLLCLPPFWVDPIVSGPGVPFTIPVPNNCNFVGLPLCTQGLSFDAGGTLLLTNALDITLGTP